MTDPTLDGLEFCVVWYVRVDGQGATDDTRPTVDPGPSTPSPSHD